MSVFSKIMKGVARTGIAIYNGSTWVTAHPEVVGVAAAINPAAAGIILTSAQGISAAGGAIKSAKEASSPHGSDQQQQQPPQNPEGVRGDGQGAPTGDRQQGG
jgi:hypothetical protein